MQRRTGQKWGSPIRKELIIRILYLLFRTRGAEIFKCAADRAWLTILFAFMHKRLSRNPKKYIDNEQFKLLFVEVDDLSWASKRRYKATLYDDAVYSPQEASERLSSCMNTSCDKMKSLKATWVKNRGWSELSEEQKDAIKSWGSGVKLCGR